MGDLPQYLQDYIQNILELEQNAEFTKLSSALREKLYEDPALTEITKKLFVDLGLNIGIGGPYTASYDSATNTIYFGSESSLDPDQSIFSVIMGILAHEIFHAEFATHGFNSRGDSEAYATLNSVEFLYRVGIGLPASLTAGGLNGQANLIALDYIEGRITREEARQRIDDLPWPGDTD